MKKKTKYTTLTNNNNLNPHFVTGFCDASPTKQKLIRQFSKKALQKMSTNTSLVLWGTNLTSQVGYGRFTKQVSNMIKFPPYQRSVILG